MRRPWFRTEPVDESFFEQAPLRLRETFAIRQPTQRVWDELTADDPLSWCRILSGLTWTSPRPFGVGTTRTARLFGGVSEIHERFFRWEEGRRKSFYVVEAADPLFRRIAEDYLVEPATEKSCRFTWTVAAEPRPAARIGNPLSRRLLATLFTDTRRHYGLDGA